MGRPLQWTAEQKLPLVLSVLRGEGSVAEIARRHRVSDVTLAKWQDAFLAGGTETLTNGTHARPSSRETVLETELEDVKAALGEAHAELRVWRKRGRSTRLRGPAEPPGKPEFPDSATRRVSPSALLSAFARFGSFGLAPYRRVRRPRGRRRGGGTDQVIKRMASSRIPGDTANRPS